MQRRRSPHRHHRDGRHASTSSHALAKAYATPLMVAAGALAAFQLLGLLTADLGDRRDIDGRNLPAAVSGADSAASLQAAGADDFADRGQALQPAPRASGASTAVSVPDLASGHLRVVRVGRKDRASAVSADGRRRTLRFTVEVETGLPVDPAVFAAVVLSTLNDRRSWPTVDGVRLQPVDAVDLKKGAHADIRVTLASPTLTDRLCAPLRTRGEVSCWNGDRAVLNAKRWVMGAHTYAASLAQYREYVVNHEVGHALGHHHASCPGRGRRAPVMLQQTLSLGACKAWPWPSGAA